jgi:hypothetical protein
MKETLNHIIDNCKQVLWNKLLQGHYYY